MVLRTKNSEVHFSKIFNVHNFYVVGREIGKICTCKFKELSSADLTKACGLAIRIRLLQSSLVGRPCLHPYDPIGDKQSRTTFKETHQSLHLPIDRKQVEAMS
jgi:hypothetical protein